MVTDSQTIPVFSKIYVTMYIFVIRSGCWKEDNLMEPPIFHVLFYVIPLSFLLQVSVRNQLKRIFKAQFLKTACLEFRHRFREKGEEN